MLETGDDGWSQRESRCLPGPCGDGVVGDIHLQELSFGLIAREKTPNQMDQLALNLEYWWAFRCGRMHNVDAK